MAPSRRASAGSADLADPRPRRQAPRLFATIESRRWLRVAGVILLAAIAGYLVSLIAYPAPLVARDRQVGLIVGLPASEAEKELTGQGFRVKFLEAREADPSLPAGSVAWQDPPAFVELARGAVVVLTLSSGPAPVTVPDVVRFDADEARRVVSAAGLAVGNVDSVPSDADRGVVVSTRPPEGTPRPPGARIDLVVSRGPVDVRVPDLTGLLEQAARQRLGAAGLRVGLVQTRRVPRGKPSSVVEQRPGGGMFLPRGGRVDLTVVEVRSR